jgi:hypothetical protein
MTDGKTREGSTWPWPYYQLSNGVQLELSEQFPARALKTFTKEGRGRKITLKEGDRCALRAEPSGLVLIKYGTGNCKFYDMQRSPVEGVDYELLPNSSAADILCVNEKARMSNDEREESLRQLARDGPFGGFLF